MNEHKMSTEMTTTKETGDDKTTYININEDVGIKKIGESSSFNNRYPLDIPAHPDQIRKDGWKSYMIGLMNKDSTSNVLDVQEFGIMTPSKQYSEVKPNAYIPTEVTIGPNYATLEHNQGNNHKANVLRTFMDTYEITTIDELLGSIDTRLREGIKSYYSRKFSQTHTDIEWLQLVVIIDTVFLLYCLILLYGDTGFGKGLSAKALHRTFFYKAQRDFLLIGNQIPLSLLKDIWNTYSGNVMIDCETAVRHFIVRHNPFFSIGRAKGFFAILDSEGIRLTDKAQTLVHCLYLSCTLPERPGTGSSASEGYVSGDKENRTVSHYVRFRSLRKLLGCASKDELATPIEQFVRLPTASELRKVGISFEACEGNLSVIRYDKRTRRLHLPKIAVLDRTQDMLRNLIALEDDNDYGSAFWMYGVIMEQLIATQEDLAILEKAKVIENHLGPGEESVKMWKNMCIDKSYDLHTQAMVNDIVDDYSSRCNLWRVEFHDRFLARPWYTASAIAAVLLLVATIFQTVFTVLAYLTPKI